MWVAEPRRRQGIGRALMRPLGALARELGCTHAVLNATEEGEELYRAVGFASLGRGQTWWMHEGERPNERQGALVRAIGGGDPAALGSARADERGARRDDPGPGQAARRRGRAAPRRGRRLDPDARPALISRPVGGRGATLLHVAVERDDEAMVRVALAHGADLLARDRTWNGTPLDWAEFLGHEPLAALLREQS